MDRFWSKVDRRGPDECWPWKAARSKKRQTQSGHEYGFIRIGGRKGKTHKAHRFLWETTRGPIPADLEVCHSCDNTLCVNPAHLFLGTHLMNMRDCVRKGRHVRGARHVGAKLQPNQVRAIRADPRRPFETIAREYGISRALVSKIKRGAIWGYLP